MFKVGDKVLYNGEKRTVVFAPENNSEEKWLHDDFVILDHDLFFAISIDDLEPYETAHDKLLALGWKNNDCYYEMGNHCIVINKEEKTFEISSEVGYSLEIDLEISLILTQYLEELNEV